MKLNGRFIEVDTALLLHTIKEMDEKVRGVSDSGKSVYRVSEETLRDKMSRVYDKPKWYLDIELKEAVDDGFLRVADGVVEVAKEDILYGDDVFKEIEDFILEDDSDDDVW